MKKINKNLFVLVMYTICTNTNNNNKLYKQKKCVGKKMWFNVVVKKGILNLNMKI